MEPEQEDQQYDFSVVDTLHNMFGDVITKDVIMTVVESCDGDLSLSAEAIMNMTSDSSNTESKNQQHELPSSQNTVGDQSTPLIQSNETNPVQSATLHNTSVDETIHSFESFNIQNQENPSSNFRESISYAVMSRHVTDSHRTTGAVPKKTITSNKSSAFTWSDQMQRINSYHNQGSRVLVLIRGAPGSGKSYLARQIVDMTVATSVNNYKKHIFSTDDYFMVRGTYQYDRSRISAAHEWNQNRVRAVLGYGLSPVLIDNTNIEIWEMEPYVRQGVYNGYIIEVAVPTTAWAKKANQLAKKNTHNVPIANIKRMLDNFQDGITGDYLLRFWGLSYPADMVPPVLRTSPEVVNNTLQKLNANDGDIKEQKEQAKPEKDFVNTNETEYSSKHIDDSSVINPSALSTPIADVNEEMEEKMREMKYLEMQKRFEQLEQVEREWENGENWDEIKDSSPDTSEVVKSFEPKPPRQENPYNSMLETVQNCDDWRQISMFMPSWNERGDSESVEQSKTTVEKTSTATCFEVGDTDLHNQHKIMKIINANPRDINMFHLPLHAERIPEKRMLDKSTWTNEIQLAEAFKCQDERKHFVAFRKLFKNIPKADLQDVFDKCCGDVNWAVDIILDGMANNQLKILNDEELSDVEDELSEQCSCVSAYSVVPDANIDVSNIPIPICTSASQDAISVSPSNTAAPKRTKSVPSKSSVRLKRQIEKNVVISDEHYSDHCLRIRKLRRGESDPNDASQVNEIPSTSVDVESIPLPDTSEEGATCLREDQASDGEDSNSSGVDDIERTVNINLGPEFLTQLDNMFGRQDMTYPDNIVPRINIPISLLNEINAFWMESLMHQMDEHDKKNEQMVLEDAEFARQLELKEIELLRAGREPEVPDFKEIMDIDLAVSLYKKNIAEWRNKEPNDLAAKMTRDKLYALFPDMSQDVLSELLMAHDNNFKATVEVLLMSTGNGKILEEENGLNKFVMTKELEVREKALEEERKALEEVEWPPLPKEKVDMAMVEHYRIDADKHLNRRNISYQKAQEYIRRGMTQMANYYSDIASYHKRRYEQSNSMAAVTLVQVHAENSENNATIDLHYLRVGEARESLDLFLDTHIRKLGENPNGPRYHALYLITGRGRHSSGRPKIKPAVKKRLAERGLSCSERNPGLLQTKVWANSRLSYQVEQP